MKDVAEITRLPPVRRLSSIRQLVETLRSSPEAKAKLSEWGLEVCPDVVTVKARKLDPVTLHFGGGAKEVRVFTHKQFKHFGASFNKVFPPSMLTCRQSEGEVTGDEPRPQSLSWIIVSWTNGPSFTSREYPALSNKCSSCQCNQSSVFQGQVGGACPTREKNRGSLILKVISDDGFIHLY